MDVQPVPWEDIEKMSLCTPRGSWVDELDSDVSDPESDDRETIFTNELSPTPSDRLGTSVRLFAYAGDVRAACTLCSVCTTSTVFELLRAS